MSEETRGMWETKRSRTASNERVRALQVIFMILGVLVAGRLVQLQLFDGANYRLLASNQHELERLLVPERGRILVRDRADGTLHPIATNRDAWLLYAIPREMDDSAEAAKEVAPYTPYTEAELALRFADTPDDPYEPLVRGLSTTEANEIKEKNIRGIGLLKTWARTYPEEHMGGHLIGFVRTDESGIGTGSYGIEGAYDDLLAGTPGFVMAQKDAGGRRLMLGGGDIRHARDGSDVILTIDRTIQYEVCSRLQSAVKRFDADSGTVIVMDPNTGAIISMCSDPDFDPEHFGETKNIAVFNNPATFAMYEPGSVFKAITMALGLEYQKITPNTSYEDAGVELIDDYEIKNSDEKAHGMRTMTQVLEESLNTGTIFVERLLGQDLFREGVEAFGFGEKTGIELTPEAAGNMSGLSKSADVYGATASFGQGISVTPIQLVTAFSAIANDGKLMRPHVIEEIVHSDGVHDTIEPTVVGEPISLRASRLLSGMLVSVVERGHSRNASIPGYFVAGKTGTAQIANPKGQGYLEGAHNATFIGYTPVDDPACVMLVKFENPRVGQWAESTALPFWHDIAEFLLAYLEVPMDRDLNAPREVDSIPTLPATLDVAPDVVSIDND